jgi:LacI family transcriptional regulator
LRQISSLIIAPIAPDQSYLMPWLPHKPIVFIDREPDGIDADVFLEDDYGGADLAVRHLMELGHRRIAFLGANDVVATTSRRLEGFKAAYQAAGVPLDDSLILLAGPGLIGDMLTRTLSGHTPPTAIFSSNSRTSIEIIPTLQQLERTDLAMVGFGDFPMASALHPAVSVIDQNPSRLGRAAAERAVNRVSQSQAAFERCTVFQVNLIRRASSRPIEG